MKTLGNPSCSCLESVITEPSIRFPVQWSLVQAPVLHFSAPALPFLMISMPMLAKSVEGFSFEYSAPFGPKTSGVASILIADA